MTFPAAPEFILHPSSLLVPVNTTASFECAAHCVHTCSVLWYIGDNSAAHEHQRKPYERQGFTFIDQPTIELANGTYAASAKLTVNVSVNVNGSLIRCRTVLSGEHIHNSWSQLAILEMISGKTFLSHM